MRRIMLLIVVSLFVVPSAEAQDSTCLGIRRVALDQYLFYLPPKAKAARAHYYVKAVTKASGSNLSPRDELRLGENLHKVPDQTLPKYEIPELALKLYILQETEQPEDMDPAAQITPVSYLDAMQIDEFHANSRAPSIHITRQLPEAPYPIKSEKGLCVFMLS
jgi:hypothetical protein